MKKLSEQTLYTILKDVGVAPGDACELVVAITNPASGPASEEEVCARPSPSAPAAHTLSSSNRPRAHHLTLSFYDHPRTPLTRRRTNIRFPACRPHADEPTPASPRISHGANQPAFSDHAHTTFHPPLLRA